MFYKEIVSDIFRHLFLQKNKMVQTYIKYE